MLTKPCAHDDEGARGRQGAILPHQPAHRHDQRPSDLGEGRRIRLETRAEPREQQGVPVRVRVHEGAVGVGGSAQVGARVGGRRGSGHRPGEIGDDIVGHEADQIGAVADVLVERGTTDADPVADLGHDDGIEPVLLEDDPGGLDDARRARCARELA